MSKTITLAAIGSIVLLLGFSCGGSSTSTTPTREVPTRMEPTEAAPTPAPVAALHLDGGVVGGVQQVRNLSEEAYRARVDGVIGGMLIGSRERYMFCLLNGIGSESGLSLYDQEHGITYSRNLMAFTGTVDPASADWARVIIVKECDRLGR